MCETIEKSMPVCGTSNIKTTTNTLDTQTVVSFTTKYNYFIGYWWKCFLLSKTNDPNGINNSRY